MDDAEGMRQVVRLRCQLSFSANGNCRFVDNVAKAAAANSFLQVCANTAWSKCLCLTTPLYG